MDLRLLGYGLQGPLALHWAWSATHSAGCQEPPGAPGGGLQGKFIQRHGTIVCTDQSVALRGARWCWLLRECVSRFWRLASGV